LAGLAYDTAVEGLDATPDIRVCRCRRRDGAVGLCRPFLFCTTAPAAIPFIDRISWAAHDLVGILFPYGALTSIALLVAFLVAGALARFSGFRVTVFGIAGATALFVLFITMRRVLGTVGIFGARGPAGLAAQMAIGAIAGVLFARLSTSRAAPR
jgi:hypothetical protein